MIARPDRLLDERNFRLVPGAAAFDLTVLPVTDARNTSREQYERFVEFLAGSGTERPASQLCLAPDERLVPCASRDLQPHAVGQRTPIG